MLDTFASQGDLAVRLSTRRLQFGAGSQSLYDSIRAGQPACLTTLHEPWERWGYQGGWLGLWRGMTTIAENDVAARQPRTKPAPPPLAQADEPTVERPIIAAVIYLLGGCALLGLTGVIVLIAVKADASSLAALTALVGPAIGGLASIMATTRTSPPASAPKDTDDS